MTTAPNLAYIAFAGDRRIEKLLQRYLRPFGLQMIYEQVGQ